MAFSSATLPISKTLTAGNSILVSISAADFSGSTGTPVSVVSDVDGALTMDVQSTAVNGGNCRWTLWRLHNCAGGATTVTITFAGTINVIWATLVEVSGLAAAAPDVTAINDASSSTPTSGTTGTTSAADAFAIAGLEVAGTNGGDTAISIDPPGGSWVSQGLNQDAWNRTGHSTDTLILSATGTQSASWGTLWDSMYWTGGIAVYLAAGGGGAPSPNIPGYRFYVMP